MVAAREDCLAGADDLPGTALLIGWLEKIAGAGSTAQHCAARRANIFIKVGRSNRGMYAVLHRGPGGLQ